MQFYHRPHVPIVASAPRILALGTNESPNFIHFDIGALQIAKSLVVNLGAASPTRTPRRMIVSRCTPVTRSTARMLEPSQSFSVERLFIFDRATLAGCRHACKQNRLKYIVCLLVACYVLSRMTDDQSIQSLGGDARAKALSAEKRSEIARNAAMAKHEKESSLPKATHGSPDRPLRIGNLEIPCYVLDNGKRVITQAGVLLALSMSAGTAKKGGGDRIANFVNTNAIKPFASIALHEMITSPIKFRAQGSIAYGYDATILPEICDAVMEAKEQGKLNYQQEHIYKQASILIRAFARVGIIALVDEATGYQDVRDRQALAEILKKYIDGALYEWAKTFPLALYKEIFRLNGWAWNNGKMPGVVGTWTNDLVYDRLEKGVLDELQRLNPRTEKGHRRHRHHQLLTPDFGHPSLSQRLYELLGMARACSTWDQFYRLVDRTFPRMGHTMALNLPE